MGSWIKKLRTLPLRYHLLLMAGVVLVGFLSVVWGLSFYTNHDTVVQIPELRGKSLSQVAELLDAAELRYEVVDSVYDKSATPGTVIEVYPAVGQSVKPHRIIFLKVYGSEPPRVSAPYVKDMSARQAYALLQGMGFESVSQRAVPGEYMGLCQGLALASGQLIEPGTLITKDTPLVLLVVGAVQLDSLSLDDLLGRDPEQSVDSLGQRPDSLRRGQRNTPEPEHPDDNPENWW